jgi:outer membrane biosynthesis protein TonB
MTLMPSLPAPELRAKPKETSGDLSFAKPNEKARDDQGKAEQARPRTLAEAEARQAAKIPGKKMKQDGGVKRRLDFSSLDAKATPFGAYDAAFIEAVSQRWYDLVDGRGFTVGQQGRVVVEFNLKYDGRITDMTVVDSSVGEVLSLFCQKAVLDPAPFAAWPSDMRRTLGDSRAVRFTFYYN